MKSDTVSLIPVTGLLLDNANRCWLEYFAKKRELCEKPLPHTHSFHLFARSKLTKPHKRLIVRN